MWLRQGREQRGISIDEVARITKIQARILERLESGRLEGLPADVFVRGFVRNVARCVGLDEDEAVRRYAACGTSSGATGPSTTATTATARAFVETMSDLAPVAADGLRARPARTARLDATGPVVLHQPPVEFASGSLTALEGPDRPAISEPTVAAPVAIDPSLAAPVVVAPVVVAPADTADTADTDFAADTADTDIANEPVATLAIDQPVVIAPIAAVDTATAEPASAARGKKGRRKAARRRGASVAPAAVVIAAIAPVDVEAPPVVAVVEAPPGVAAVEASAVVEASVVVAVGEAPPVVDDVEVSAMASTCEAVATSDELATVAEAFVAAALTASEPEPEAAEPGGETWSPRMPAPAVHATPTVPWRRSARPVRRVTSAPTPSLVIDDSDPDSAERELEERVGGEAPRRSFLPPILLDREDRSRQGGLTLAVIILLIAATLTLSYLMRRPSSTAAGVTEATPALTGDVVG
jgi:hypothetical protein